MSLIIDCHGHYTTAPPSLEAWRNRQITAIGNPSQMPKASELHISDDELRETIEKPIAPDERARCRYDLVLTACQFYGTPHRRF